MFFYAVSACLWSLASYCNMAITVALEELGHDALTVEEFTIFRLVVVEQAYFNKEVGFLWGVYVH